jgi:hypothetical protein
VISCAGRGITVAAVGAALGWVLSQIDTRALAAQVSECSGQSGLCFGEAFVVGPLIGVLATIAVCWAGFAIARFRPLWCSVPTGIVLTLFDVLAYLRLTSGGRLVPAWALMTVMAITFFLLSVIVGAVSARNGSRH